MDDQRVHHQVFAHLLLLRFSDHVRALLDRSPTLPFYTPHGLEHIQGVENRVRYLLGFHGSRRAAQADQPNPLTPVERLILRFCAWGHDLGMIQEIAEEYEKTQVRKDEPEESRLERLRENHDRASAYFIRREIPERFEEVYRELNDRGLGRNRTQVRTDLGQRLAAEVEGVEADRIDRCLDRLADEGEHGGWRSNATDLAYTVNLIAGFHRRAEPIETCPEERTLFGESVRAQLLAALFRLADALQVDRSRFLAAEYNVIGELPEFSEESRLHWIRSVIVSDIRIDLQRCSIHVQADLPIADSSAGDGGDGDLTDASLQEMLRFIRNDLEEEVLSVAPVLVQHHFPPLLGVTDEVHQIPAMEYPEDIRAALRHILAASSPNTSQLNTIFLEALAALLREAERIPEGETREQYLERGIERLIAALAYQRTKRPCHEGLRKIEDLLIAVSRLWGAEDDRVQNAMNTLSRLLGRGRLLWTLLDGVSQLFRRQREETEEGARLDAFSDLFKGTRAFVLYGFSSQAIKLLAHFYSRRKAEMPKIHVLECRTKTAYSPTGHLLYIDAYRYARRLRPVLDERDELTIVPDVALARILRGRKRPKQKTVVLLGSNAVYPDGTFVHSMGHLSVAAVAKSRELESNCEVIVVTDSMKIGDVLPAEDDYHQPRERNPDRWLTHNRPTLDDLKRLRVKLHNWLEDRVPPGFVDKLIVLDRREALDPGSFGRLGDLMFRQRSRYCDQLETRLLAATITHAKPPADAEEALRALQRRVDSHVRDWQIAEAFTRGDEDGGHRDGDGSPEVSANGGANGPEADAVESWLKQIWTRRQSDAVGDLVRAITNCPEKDQPGSAAEESAAGEEDQPAASFSQSVSGASSAIASPPSEPQ